MLRHSNISQHSKNNQRQEYSRRSKSIYNAAQISLRNDPLKEYFEQQKESIMKNDSLSNQIQKIMELGLLKQRKDNNQMTYQNKNSIIKMDCLQKSNKSKARGVGGSIYTS